MPPKGSKSRPHPYPEGTRKSTRKRVASTRLQEAVQTQEASDHEVIGNQGANQSGTVVVQPTTSHNNGVDPQPSTSQGTGQQNPSTPPLSSVSSSSIQNNEPDSVVAIANNDPQPQVQPNVSRDEFNNLKESMNSMKQMFSTFMSTFQPSSSNNNADSQPSPAAGSAVHVPFGPPLSVPINNTITSQPVSQISSDSNIHRTFNVPSAEQAANDIVNRAVQEHVRAVSDGKATSKGESDRISYQLDRKIPQAVMRDIWDDKFVDLELLIDKEDNPDLPMVMKTVHSNELGQIVQLVKPKQPKGILDIAQWSRAFDVYMSIYTRKFYMETPNLLTYSHKVKELASKGGDFLRYDTEFRKARSRYGSPWEVPDLELLVDCNQAGLQHQILKVINTLKNGGEPIPTPIQSFPTPSQPFPTQSIPAPSQPFPSDHTSLPNLPRHPPGYCYTYHNRGRCGRTNCKFSHRCYNPGCNENHSVFTCPLSPNSGLSSPSSSGNGGTSNSNSRPASSPHPSQGR